MNAEMSNSDYCMSDMLKGVKVVELASVLAGPLAGSFLAELGATVIKIENKVAGGDVTRQWRLDAESNTQSVSAYYASANTGKEVAMLDLTDDVDYGILLSHIKSADIVISNFQKRAADKLKVDHATIHGIKPEIIFAQLSAYRYEDPRPGYDLVMQAEAGYISMTGTSTEHLAKMPVAMIDIIAGHQLKEAILLGMIRKLQTGKGSLVEVSLYKSAISGLANQASNYLMEDHVAMPIGTQHPNIAPYGDIVTTKDGVKLILAVGSDAQFGKLGKTLNFTEAQLHTFSRNKDRVVNRSELSDELQHEVGRLSFEKLSPQLTAERIPFCRVSNMKTVFEDPIAIEMIINEDLEGVPARKVRNVAFDMKEAKT